ncbi:LTA synthase family protein [Alkalihalobacillus sp. AL-G]|uniref:LTA synthase family protein n=1 Tax=Alkalihalobacillus sp. AL-G TaxID=2926399 RepID=UPI00272D1FFE|nr:LTA synthase family protein [Alkalihalobacillus sp. AL-G]WLD92984.1 LTA synthase family protein [Alkalihalobacillus sp. AL-G]
MILKNIISNKVSIYFLPFVLLLFLKVVLFRFLLLDDLNLLTTLWFELPIILIFLCLFEWLNSKAKPFAYFLFNILLSLMFFASLVYSAYFGTLPTYFDLQQLGQVSSVSESILLLIKPTYFLIFIDLLILVLLFNLTRAPQWKLSQRAVSIIIIFAVIISMANFLLVKTQFIKDPVTLAHNKGVFNFELAQIYADFSETAAAQLDFNNKGIQEIKGNTLITNVQDREKYGLAKNRNLILIQLESFQDFVINLKIDGTEITPNLNRLVNEGIYFSNVYQQIGAGNTSDAEFIVNTSLYPIGNKPTSKIYPNKRYPSMPRLLSKQGYVSATFHADEVEYWNRDRLYPALGFQEYYDIKYYGDKDTVGFGPSDEYFYKKTVPILEDYQDKKQRFYAHVLSLTSHTPFELPKEKQLITLPKKFDDTLTGNYIISAHYADHALGLFIEDLKDKGIWEDSIIGIYGDHSGVHGQLLKNEDVKLMKQVLGHGYSIVDRFNIPFIVNIPGENTGFEVDKLGGQLDIMPTLLNLMGVDMGEQIHFGQDLLNYDKNLLGMRYYLPAGSFFRDNILLVPQTSTRPKRIYDLETKQLFETNKYNEYYDKMLKLLHWSDSYIQNLPTGL